MVSDPSLRFSAADGYPFYFIHCDLASMYVRNATEKSLIILIKRLVPVHRDTARRPVRFLRSALEHPQLSFLAY